MGSESAPLHRLFQKVSTLISNWNTENLQSLFWLIVCPLGQFVPQQFRLPLVSKTWNNYQLTYCWLPLTRCSEPGISGHVEQGTNLSADCSFPRSICPAGCEGNPSAPMTLVNPQSLQTCQETSLRERPWRWSWNILRTFLSHTTEQRICPLVIFALFKKSAQEGAGQYIQCLWISAVHERNSCFHVFWAKISNEQFLHFYLFSGLLIFHFIKKKTPPQPDCHMVSYHGNVLCLYRKIDVPYTNPVYSLIKYIHCILLLIHQTAVHNVFLLCQNKFKLLLYPFMSC